MAGGIPSASALIELARKKFAEAAEREGGGGQTDVPRSDPRIGFPSRLLDAEFPSLAIETRSVIVSTFTSMADCFLRGTLGRLFCTDVNFTPEDTFKGKIIIMNLPVKEHNELGQFAQVLFKFIWQRAVERRIPPVINRQDAERPSAPFSFGPTNRSFSPIPTTRLFQSTARSSRACTVYLTQNLPELPFRFRRRQFPRRSRGVRRQPSNQNLSRQRRPDDQQLGGGFHRQDPPDSLQRRHVRAARPKPPRAEVSRAPAATSPWIISCSPRNSPCCAPGGEECGMQGRWPSFSRAGGAGSCLDEGPEPEVQNYIRHVFPQVYERHPR